MFKILFLIFLLFNFLFASSLESLLEEYEDTSKNSLQTINEKMGHVRIYSQKELKLMQYDMLSDVLKELPILNLGRSGFGPYSISLAGSKTETSGYFRLFINDHEVSSAHTQSPFLNWFDLPINLIDYIEIYYGEGSFTLGSETGVKFIRIYTKKASTENGANLKTIVSNKSSNSQELSYSTLLENGWSYLLYIANQNSFFNRVYKNQELKANSSQKYAFLDIGNGIHNINVGFTTLEKDNYKGMALDSNSDSGNISSDNFFINYKTYFLDDKSLKFNMAVDIQNRKYNETDTSTISIPRFLGTPITSYTEDIQLTKTSASVSKTFKAKKNNLFTALNFINKKYKTKSRTINNTTSVGGLTNFNEESSSSFVLQDDYKLLENLILIGNFKFNKYIRNGYMDNTIERLYRIGSIYLPTENLGFKTFYTISHIPPSFYNTDFSHNSTGKLKSQKYKYFTFESAYTYDNARASIEYFNVHIDDFIHYALPIGFINVDHTIKTDGFIIDYLYNIDRNSKVEFDYFATQLSEVKSGYTQGGYLKYMQDLGKFSYFTSLIYRHGFNYLGLDIKDSYNLNLGSTYNFTKNLSVSIKGTNLLNKSTQSILSDTTTGYSTPTLSLINDYDRILSFSLNWRF